MGPMEKESFHLIHFSSLLYNQTVDNKFLPSFSLLFSSIPPYPNTLFEESTHDTLLIKQKLNY